MYFTNTIVFHNTVQDTVHSDIDKTCTRSIDHSPGFRYHVMYRVWLSRLSGIRYTQLSIMLTHVVPVNIFF